MHTRGVIASPKLSGTFAAEPQSYARVASVPVQLALGLRSLVLVDNEAEMRRRFAYALRAALSQKGWSGPQLADALHVDASTVSRWVGEKSVPSILWTKRLAEKLSVRPEFLFDPPPVPEYPLSEYLIREATDGAVDEGVRRARRRRAAEAP